MNLRKGGSAACIIGLSIFCCFLIFASAAPAATILKSEKFTLIPPEDPASSIPFQIVEPGKVIIEVTTAEPLGRLGIITRGYYPNAVPKRKDGPTPLRIEFQVTAADIQKGVRTWHAFPTVMAPNKSFYNSSGKAITGEVKISFVPDRPASGTAQSGAPPPSSAGTATGKATTTSQPPATAGTATGKIATTSQPPASTGTATGKTMAGTATAPAQTSRLQAAPLQGKTLSKVGPAPTATQARLPNPSGFTATAGAGGAVTLKWNTVPNAIYYNLQGPGVLPVSGMPPNIQGTTFTVKGLPAGNHQWALFAVYSGPSGPHFGDESNPARVSASVSGPASGRYRVTVNGLRVNNATWDTALQSDGKGDEIFLLVDLQELAAGGKPAGAAQTRSTFVYGDTNGFPARIAAGSLSPKGGLRSGDTIPNVSDPWRRYTAPQQKQLPLSVWEGLLVDGQNAVLIVPAIWEQDRTDKLVAVFNTAENIWGLTLKPFWDGFSSGYIDPAATHKFLFGEDFAAVQTGVSDVSFLIFMPYNRLLKELSPQKDLNPMNMVANWLGAAAGNVLGESRDRPIGMIEYAGGYVFDPQVITLNYRTAEASLAPNALQRGPGILEIRYVDAQRLAGNYTLYVQIEKVQ